MDFEINSFYDLGRYWGIKEGKQEGKKEGRQEGIRDMLKKCLNIRFPLMSQAALNNILTISDLDVLESIFNVACKAESLDNFLRDVQELTPTNRSFAVS